MTDINAGAVATQENSGFTRELAMMSYFGRINYDYAGKYLFEANFRADASSRFSKSNRWGYFPSVSAAWRISEESFMEGTQDWETTTNWGIAVETSIFSCLDFSVEYYSRVTDGIIMDVLVPATFGLGAYKDNVGKMENRGVEVTASFHKQWGDWRFNASGNVAFNHNEVLDLGVGGDKISNYYINRVGEADDRRVGGAEQPKVTFGLNLNTSWKNFDLSVLLQGATGVERYFTSEVFGEFYGDDSHPSTIWLDAWSTENPDGSFPRVALGGKSASDPSNYSSFWMQSANYLRIKNVQFGYTLPKKWLKGLGISNAKVYYSGENLFCFDSLPVDVDPEAPSGRGSHYPQIAIHSIGVNLTF